MVVGKLAKPVRGGRRAKARVDVGSRVKRKEFFLLHG
jgi:hypothetical protein